MTEMSAKKGSTSIYNQTLRYYNPAKGTAALYSGNISEWSSQQASQQQETYGFTYDLQGRLTQSNRYSGTGTSAQSSYTERGITYDRNGNILTLQRYASALQDNYTYTYNGNRLTSISGTNNGTAIVSASYSYDNNGNTVQDGLKGLQISYNILNLPQTVTQSGTTKATYGWFADGSKYSVQDALGNGYCYIGSLIYSTTAGAAVLESTDFSGGRIVLSGNTQTIHYHHKDHLGSVRAITDGSGSTIEQNAYYPFGGRHTFGQTYAQTASNRYKFNGKELQTIGNLDLLDYGARMYDTKIGRWLVQDPLAEKYYPFSGYNYCVNNPIMFVDPDGKAVETAWDLISLGTGLKSLWGNIRQGNVGAAIADGLGVILDAAAAATPFVPGGVSAAIGAVRVIDKVDDVSDLSKVHRNTDNTFGLKTDLNTPNTKRFNGNNDTYSSSSNEAFRKAKDQNGIPRSQQPNKTIKANTPEGNDYSLDDRNVKLYEFTNYKGETILIRQDKSVKYSNGYQPKHFNAGLKNENKLKQHHNYGL